ncbi:MAG: hypothetical protein LUE27_11505 [Clostridia bacterium]|nr:hypothetical protein [Clostridia bacterium]
MTLEKFLQDNFWLKGDLFREKPVVDSDGVEHWFTDDGMKAYGRFTDFIFDLSNLCEDAGVGHSDIDDIIEEFDQFDTEPPEL